MSLNGILSIGEAPDHSVHTGAPLTGTLQASLTSFKALITICGFHHNVSAARRVSDGCSSIAGVQNCARLLIGVHSLLMKRGRKKRVRRRKGNHVSISTLSTFSVYCICSYPGHMHGSSTWTPLLYASTQPIMRGIFSHEWSPYNAERWRKRQFPHWFSAQKCMIFKIID